MTRELNVEQAENGFVVTYKDYSGRKRVCRSFKSLTEFMHGYFHVGKEEEEKKQ